MTITKTELPLLLVWHIYMEKFLQNPRHVEVQVLSDGQGQAIHLGDRDCYLTPASKSN